MRRLAREASVLLPRADDDSLPERLAIAFLRGERPEAYAAQVNLRPQQTPLLIKDPTAIRVRPTFADLVRRDQTTTPPTYSVIDIKATKRATPFHKAQIAFYTHMLDAMLGELRIPSQIHPEGEVWFIPQEGTAEGDTWMSERFLLAPYLRLVHDFCRQILPEIAAKRVERGRDETFFHLYFKCEQCEYLSHCRRAIETSVAIRDVSAVPGLSHEGKRVLLNAGVRSVEQLAKLTSLAGLGQGWALRQRGELLIARARAQQTDVIEHLPGSVSYLMPARVDVIFVLLADYDPIDDTLVSIGFMRYGPAGERTMIEVLPQGDRASEAEALVRVFTVVIEELTAIDRSNAAIPEGNPAAVHAHIFVYEPAEAVNLQKAVGRHLDDARIRTGLLHLVRMFPPEEVVPEPEFRGMHHLPATALRSVFEQLYAVPALTSYDLGQVSRAVANGATTVRGYQPGEAFARPFSSLLAIDVIRRLRDQRRGPIDRRAVEQDVRDRLIATMGLAQWLLDQNSVALQRGEPAFLRLSKKPFRFQASFDPLAASDLDVLQAFELLENRAGLLETLVSLAEPAVRRRDAGRCIAGMRLLNRWDQGGWRHVMQFDVPRESRESDLGVGDYDLIISDDNPDIRLDPQMWTLFRCSLAERQPHHPPNRLLVSVTRTQAAHPLFDAMRRRVGDGANYFVDRTFKDVNTTRSAGFLRYLAGQP